MASGARRKVLRLGTLAAGGALAASAVALAATPKAGCWGTCGGDRGPVGGTFMVQHSRVVGFAAELKCLGTRKIPQPPGRPAVVVGNLIEVPPQTVPTKPGQRLVQPPIPIRKGRFDYTGTARRYSGQRSYKVKVDLAGRFVTSTEAKVALTIAYGKCGTQRLVIPFG
jgi:hypothetical protein